jgi:hypothetical protein
MGSKQRQSPATSGGSAAPESATEAPTFLAGNAAAQAALTEVRAAARNLGVQLSKGRPADDVEADWNQICDTIANRNRLNRDDLDRVAEENGIRFVDVTLASARQAEDTPTLDQVASAPAAAPTTRKAPAPTAGPDETSFDDGVIDTQDVRYKSKKRR